MGKIDKVFYEKLIDPEPDRFANRVKTQHNPNGEVTIHFRNLKIVLHTKEEIAEWREGCIQALANLGDNLQDDI